MAVQRQATCSKTEACKAESGVMLIHVMRIVTVEVQPRTY